MYAPTAVSPEVAAGITTLCYGYDTTDSSTSLFLKTAGGSVSGSTFQRGYLMTRPGSIVGVSLVVDVNAWTSGDIRAGANISGAGKLRADLTLSGTGDGQEVRVTADPGEWAFSAGDVIMFLRSLVNSPSGITTDDMQGMIEIYYDEV